jgi:predicted nucleotidyltransferase
MTTVPTRKTPTIKIMATNAPPEARQPRRYRPPNVPMRVIRRCARQIAERFAPEKIILFGSFAYGKPHADSDVDLLVVMPAANEINQSNRRCLALEAPFPAWFKPSEWRVTGVFICVRNAIY